jgi:diguanylate cyclase (GGDEF)-like protein
MKSEERGNRVSAVHARRRGRLRAVRVPFSALLSSISFRLVAVVLATGLIAFGVLGISTSWRFNHALNEQAQALGELSERQLADRLKSEAQLARARVEAIGAQVSGRLRQLVERKDVIRAIESRNDVIMRELFGSLARSHGFDRFVAFDEVGRVVGSDSRRGVLEIHGELQDTHLKSDALDILGAENSRENPRGYMDMQEFETVVVGSLEFPPEASVGHLAIEPVFDDFGDLIGALAAIRLLKNVEPTLENFTTLSNAGVAIALRKEIISGAGPKNAAFLKSQFAQSELIRSDDNAHVARCVGYEKVFEVCAFTDAVLATASRDQMFRIGSDQSASLMQQLLLAAAMTLTALVAALLMMVRHSTRGLSSLVVAARAVAAGDLDVRLKPDGIGEVYDLSIAFIRMLAHLRTSMGRIRQLAFFDSVTQLPNREKIRVDAPELIGAAKSGAVFFLDLDGFKAINDTFGHRAGDALLKQVAERLTGHFSEVKIAASLGNIPIARVGGDEFVVIVPGDGPVARAGEIARGIIKTLGQPFDIGGTRVAIGTSIGITVFPADGTTYDELLVNADLAMYAAKERGRNSFAFFSADLSEKAKTRLSLENDLKSAIQNQLLSVHYQPKISCPDGRIRGVEALVRWNHSQSGNISPEEFLGIAEEAGLIGEVDRFVVDRAISEIGALIKAGADLTLAVNVTASEIADPQFMQDILRIVREHDFPATRLELEITEKAAVQSPEMVLRRVSILRQLGVRLAIDDFGAGYSNLATLARLPFDSLKLDRSLISGARHDPEKQSVARIAFALARELGLDSVAEGVESADDFKFVVEEGATMAQGYFFSAPVSIAELSTLIASNYLAPRIARVGEPRAVAGLGATPAPFSPRIRKGLN